MRLLTGALGPSDCSHALKSRFIPYLNVTEQLASVALAPGAPEQSPQATWFCAGSGSITLGISAGSTMTAPSRRSASMASAITLDCSAVRPPRGADSPGGV